MEPHLYFVLYETPAQPSPDDPHELLNYFAELLPPSFDYTATKLENPLQTGPTTPLKLNIELSHLLEPQQPFIARQTGYKHPQHYYHTLKHTDHGVHDHKLHPAIIEWLQQNHNTEI